MSMNIPPVGNRTSVPVDVSESVKIDLNKSAIVRTTEDLRTAEQNGVKLSSADEQRLKSVDHALKAIMGPNTALEFSVHKETKAIMIKVTDKDSGKVIREVPPEKLLDAAAKMMELAGILIDRKV